MCNGECFEHTTRCRECEHLIVARVNKDYSKGSGICFHQAPKGLRGNSHRWFCDEACENFELRTSDTNVLSGGTKEELIRAIEFHEFVLNRGSELEKKYYDLIGLENGYFAPENKKVGVNYVAPFYMYSPTNPYPSFQNSRDTYNLIRLHTSVLYA